MRSDNEETLAYCKEMGFTEYEAKIYLSLLSEHPASAYTISQNSGVPHSRVYDVTRRMIRRGIAVSSGTKPELFSPLSPEELVDKLRREHKSAADELEKRLAAENFISDFDPVWNLPNRTKALETTAGLIAKAEEKIFIGLWERELKELYPALKAAEARQVRLFILLYGSEKTDLGICYLHETEHMEDYRELGHTLDCSVDSTWCVSGTLGAKAPCQVVWTKNRGLVQSIQSYIAHDFYIAEIYSHFKGDLEQLFGSNMIRLRKQFS